MRLCAECFVYAKTAAREGAMSETCRHDSGLAERAQLGVNGETQWDFMKNSSWFCWTCHSLVHSCVESLGTI